MARQVRDANLETRAARKRLRIRPEPHWRALEQGLHLGYRRRANGGSWTARRRKTGWQGTGSPYDETKLGASDDIQDADGIAVLDFRQAQDAARRWLHAAVRQEAGLEPERAGPYTVADALRDYLDHYSGEGKALMATKAAVEAHIRPVLGNIELSKLTTRKLADWLRALAATAPRARTAPGKPQRHRRHGTDAESVRRRKATANRVLTVLKAALNRAWADGHCASDTAWRKVKPFRNVNAPVVRYLTEAECLRLVNACPPDFRPMVRAALLTGCRYGELTALRVADFNPDSGTVGGSPRE